MQNIELFKGYNYWRDLKGVDILSIYSQWLEDVKEILTKQDSFTFGDIVGADWKSPYDQVWEQKCLRLSDKDAWDSSRKTLGKMVRSFLPLLNQDLCTEIRVRSVNRKGHSCNEYYLYTET